MCVRDGEGQEVINSCVFFYIRLAPLHSTLVLSLLPTSELIKDA
jgi:hypothetical protein